MLRMQTYIFVGAKMDMKKTTQTNWMKHNNSQINRLLGWNDFASYRSLHLNGACKCVPEVWEMLSVMQQNRNKTQ